MCRHTALRKSTSRFSRRMKASSQSRSCSRWPKTAHSEIGCPRPTSGLRQAATPELSPEDGQSFPQFGGGHFHIRGSKLNGAGSENRSSLKSSCAGLISKLNSSGTTAEGTSRQTDEADTSHLSPTAQSSCGNGAARHDWVKFATSTRSHLTRSGIDTRMDTRSKGASSGSRFTKYSRDAKARLD